ncbi:MAG: HAD-IIIA family hydrolase [Ignavibacteria bacterium]|nr:HAD-IIIA family hydrolase [Ignavibacteria bacterium]
MLNKAVFLDRDGVLNKLIFRKNFEEYTPPHSAEEIEIINGVFESLKLLLKENYLLFIVSNQPDYAKGKVSYEKLISVCNEFMNLMVANGIHITEYNYCFHHPEGIVEGYNVKCECRKPGTLFIDNAVKKYNIDRNNSWFIGDRDSDITCGKNAKLRTIFINSGLFQLRENNSPDFFASNISEATKIILKSI